MSRIMIRSTRDWLRIELVQDELLEEAVEIYLEQTQVTA